MSDQPPTPHQEDGTPFPQPGAQPPANQQPWPQPGQQAPGMAPSNSSNGLATAGFVLGLLGFLGSFIPVLNIGGIILGVIGIILAALGLAKAKKVYKGKGLALAGLVLGGLAIVIGIIINVAFVNAVDDAIKEATNTTVQVPSDSDNNTADDGSDDAATDDTDDTTEDEAQDEATDDEAAPSSDIGTTRDNPAPLGSAISGKDWTVTINSVKTVSEDKYGSKAESGKTLLLINMTATYEGDDEQGDSAWATVKFITADGTSISSLDGSTMFIAEDSFDSLKKVYNGGSVTGDEILEVPKDGWKKGVLAVSPAMFSDDTFVAVK